jgi:predicted lactoylglutathione lyase
MSRMIFVNLPVRNGHPRTDLDGSGAVPADASA